MFGKLDWMRPAIQWQLELENHGKNREAMAIYCFISKLNHCRYNWTGLLSWARKTATKFYSKSCRRSSYIIRHYLLKRTIGCGIALKITDKVINS